MRSPLVPAPRSVRAAILTGFGILIFILAVSIGGAVFTLVQYQHATNEMQKRANIASELQTAEANGSVAALLLQRYVVSGDEYLVGEIELSAASAVKSLNNAVLLEEQAEPNAGDTRTQLSRIAEESAALTSSAAQVIELRQAGDVEAATAAIESIVPVFRSFRLRVIELADAEVAEVDRLQAESNAAGNLALTLLIVSGVAGSILALVVAFTVSRSIIRPLTRLEDTALAVALGDMHARAPAEGPRELKRLAESLNLMTTTARQRTEELRLSNEELRERNRQLLDARYQAATDPLTGLLNHRSFHETLRGVVAQRLQEGGAVSLIMIDIDNFKRVNDSLGHMAGDHVLREIGSTITEVVGEQHAYRYGGDEFAILLPHVAKSEAFSIADRLLKSVKTRVGGRDADRATVSLGVACFPDMANSAEELLYRADMALNWAKSRGKNRVGGWDQVEGHDGITFAPHLAVGGHD